MKQRETNWREKIHVEKTKDEKAAYEHFLRSPSKLKHTEEFKDSLNKTNDSNFEENVENSSQPTAPQGKSFWLKIKDLDFLKNDWGKYITIGVVSSIIGLLIWGYFTLWSDQKAQLQSIQQANKDIDSLMQKYDTTSSKVTELDKDFSVSKVEIQKDLQFLKERFNSYQR